MNTPTPTDSTALYRTKDNAALGPNGHRGRLLRGPHSGPVV